jgi:hypothetical protein
LVDDAGIDDLCGYMGHFYAIASSASIVQNEEISRVQTETISKVMEEIAGDTDRRGSDGVRVDEECGHRLRQTICKHLRRSRFEKSLNVFQ